METTGQFTLSKEERVERYGEVFTPKWLVKDMCDMMQQNADSDIFAPSVTWLEPTCGDGEMVLEVLRRKFERCKRRLDYTVSISSVWAMELQERNVEETIRRWKELCKKHFKLTKKEEQIIEDHVILADSLKVMKMVNELNGKHEGMPT